MAYITVTEVALAGRLGATLNGGIYSLMGLTMPQVQFASLLNGAVIEARNVFSDVGGFSDSDLVKYNEATLNLAAHRTINGLIGKLMTYGISYSVAGLNVNKGMLLQYLKEQAQAYMDAYTEFVRTLQIIGEIRNVPPLVFDTDAPSVSSGAGWGSRDEPDEDDVLGGGT
jgi:hypothetical protein